MGAIAGGKSNQLNVQKIAAIMSYYGSNINEFSDDNFHLGQISDKDNFYEDDKYVIISTGDLLPKDFLERYKKEKEDSFISLKGSFSIAIYEKVTKKIILVTDKFGTNSLFYTKDNFCFATEIKGILANGYPKELNLNILKDYFLYLTNPHEETIFKGIYRVPAGCYVVIKEDIEVFRYYTFTFKDLIYDENEVFEKLNQSILDSFQMQKNTASFLSSGIDSSLITTLCKVKDTYTVAYHEKEYSESYFTSVLCNYLKIENNIVTLSKREFLKAIPIIQKALDEPCLDPAVVSLYFGAKEASKKYKKVFSGEGADELFGGYNTYLDTVKYPKYNHVPFRKVITKMLLLFPEVKGINFLLRRICNVEDYYTGVSRIFNEHTLNKLLKVKGKSHISQINEVIAGEEDILHQKQIVDLKFWLHAEISATKRMGAINHLEVIMPFLSEEVVEIASAIPSSFKINGNTTKAILRKIVEMYLPEDYYQNKKLGFPVPFRKWICTKEYYNEFLKVFSSNDAKKFFNQKRLLKMLNYTYEQKKDYSKVLYSIYAFLIWYQEVFKLT
ncbi:MAG: hypothetical protein E7164_00480 [Firmicutes bacterium]|nr:hypothetical protein [Bacillota bacterium]